MSNTIQLGAIETDVTGYGPEYNRRKRKPIEPYYVEDMDFGQAVEKEFPGRDVEVEQYLVKQAHERGQNPDRPFQKILKAPDWGKGGDKIRTEHHDPNSKQRNTNEYAHYQPGGVAGYYLDEEGGPDWEAPVIEDPVIRHFKKSFTDGRNGKKDYPYTHEAMHHITSDQGGSGYERNFDFGRSWLNDPGEIMSEAAFRKRDYVHNPESQKVLTKEKRQSMADRLQQEPEYDEDGSENPYYGLTVEDYYGKGYLPENLQPLDKNHPAIKEGKNIPEGHIDEMLKNWMGSDNHGWGESYRDNPEDFPVELFKEALRLGKNDQRPAGMFTGRGPQNA